MYAHTQNSKEVTIDRSNEIKYAMHVYDPENTPPARIPSPFPINTALIHSDFVSSFTTGTTGQIIFYITPTFLATTDTRSVGYNTSWTAGAGLSSGTWSAADPNRLASGVGMAVRIVSYKMKLRYIGSELNRSGYFFAGHYHDVQTTSGSGTGNVNLPGIDSFQDGAEFEIHTADAGIEVIYKPYDNSYLEFHKTNSGTESIVSNLVSARPYNIVCGLVAGEPSKDTVLCEQFLTVEYIPDPGQQDKVQMDKCQGTPDMVQHIKSSEIIRPSAPAHKKIDQAHSFFGNAVETLGHAANDIVSEGTKLGKTIFTNKIVQGIESGFESLMTSPFTKLIP